MRVLCLHGQGASPNIMKSQIANIAALLPSSYEFDFLESPLECEPAAELQGVYPGPYFCYFPRYSPLEMQQAIEYVHEVVEEDGPYEFVMGFSQVCAHMEAVVTLNVDENEGASVAAAYIAQSQKSGDFHNQPFKMAVLMCAALIPPQFAGSGELVKTIGSFGSINIPTVHVVGKKDLCYSQSLELVRSCQKGSSQVILTNGGHDVPRDSVSARSIATAIERTLQVSLLG